MEEKLSTRERRSEILMLQRCSEVKENKEREKVTGVIELKANWETKREIKFQKVSDEEMNSGCKER